jgi:hypothetical protein
MIIIQSDIQDIPIIPNYTILETHILKVRVTDETTKEVYDLQVLDMFYQSDLLYIQLELDFLKEDYFYTIVVINESIGDKTIYKDRIFYTTQDIRKYTINEGKYVTPTINNNQYIVI